MDKIQRYSQDNPEFFYRLMSRTLYKDYKIAVDDSSGRETIREKYLKILDEDFPSLETFSKHSGFRFTENDYESMKHLGIEGYRDILHNHFDNFLMLIKDISLVDSGAVSSEFLHSIPAFVELKTMLDKYEHGGKNKSIYV